MRVATCPFSRRMPSKVAGGSAYTVGARQRGEGVLALELAHRQVLRVHVLAGCDVARGEADHLAVAAHGLAARDRAGGHLVPERDRLADRRPLAREHRPGSERRAGDDDAVAGVEAKRERDGGASAVKVVAERSTGRTTASREERAHLLGHLVDAGGGDGGGREHAGRP